MTKTLSQACANESSDSAKSLKAACTSRKEELCTHEPETIGVDFKHAASKDSEYGESNRNETSVRTRDESESLSDVDDLEIDLYLHNEQQRRYKNIIWEKLNWEYLQEQAVKEAAAKRGFDGSLATTFASASVVKPRKGKRKGQEAKSSGSVQLDQKATQTLRNKRLSSKVNFEMMEKFLDEPAAVENHKKARLELCSENHDNLESELEDKNGSDDEPKSVGEFEEETDDMGGLSERAWYDDDDDVDGGYNYEDDDYNFE